MVKFCSGFISFLISMSFSTPGLARENSQTVFSGNIAVSDLINDITSQCMVKVLIETIGNRIKFFRDTESCDNSGIKQKPITRDFTVLSEGRVAYQGWPAGTIKDGVLDVTVDEEGPILYQLTFVGLGTKSLRYTEYLSQKNGLGWQFSVELQGLLTAR